MSYTYFNRSPAFRLGETHLFSFLNVSIPLMIRVPFLTMTVDVRGIDFLNQWSKSTRYKVNRAEKEGLTVDRGHYLLPDILKLFSSTALLKGLRGHTIRDFDTRPWIQCSAVVYDGVMLCGHIWIIDTEEKRALLYVNASNHYNENDDASLTGRAHYFLLWQDGLFLRSLGIDTMDLQGYEPDTKQSWMKGVFQWKAGTHGKQETLYHYYPFWFNVVRKFRNMVTG